MALSFHPKPGTIVICDFDTGFVPPEMVKKRPVIIVSPKPKQIKGLCTVVPLSTTEPNMVMPYHYKLNLKERLPPPYDSPFHWVKGDMLATVSFDRLFLPYIGKNSIGRRKYVIKIIDENDLRMVRECILHGLDLSGLTSYL